MVSPGWARALLLQLLTELPVGEGTKEHGGIRGISPSVFVSLAGLLLPGKSSHRNLACIGLDEQGSRGTHHVQGDIHRSGGRGECAGSATVSRNGIGAGQGQVARQRAAKVYVQSAGEAAGARGGELSDGV